MEDGGGRLQACLGSLENILHSIIFDFFWTLSFDLRLVKFDTLQNQEVWMSL